MMRQIKRFWKQIIVTMVALTAIIVGIVMAFATDVILTIESQNMHDVMWTVNEEDMFTVTITGLEEEVNVDYISWTSSNPYVATVVKNTETGTAMVKAVGAGRTTITCQYSDGATISKVTTKDITVKLDTSSDKFNTVSVGDYRTLYTNYNNAVEATGMIWESSDTNIVEIVEGDGNTGRYVGTVKAVGAGVATVSAKTPAPDSQAVEFTFIVKAAFTDTSTINVEASHYASAFDGRTNAFDASYLTWGTYDTEGEHITIDNIGRIYGLNAGVTQIYMYTKYGYDKMEQFQGMTTEEIIDEFGQRLNVKVLFGVNGGDKVLTVGDIANLSVNIEDQSIAKGVNWISSDTTVAIVDSQGKVTAVGSGQATITAILEGTTLYPDDTATTHKSSITVHVVNNFAVNATEHIMNKGETFELTAIPTDTSETTTISWMSSDDRIATVQGSEDDKCVGIITALETGTVTITAIQTSADGVTKYATCVVSIKEPVYDIVITDTEVEITKGDSYQLTLMFNNIEGTIPDNLDVKWVSSDENIATVKASTSVNGLVTAINGGDAVISVITEDGIKVASCKIHVRVPVTGITLTKDRVDTSLSQGTYQLSYTILPEGDGVNRAVEWSSSNEKVATVDSNGLVTFVSPGKATIICQTVDTGVDGTNLIATCEFYINQPVISVTLDYTDITIKINETFRLTAEVNPDDATNKELWWSTSDATKATVDETGLVTAVGSGTVTIIVQSADSGVIDVCNVTVYQPVTDVSINTNSISVRKGTIFWLNATANPEGALNKTIIWSSSDESIATVDQTGMVTTLSPGKVMITATSQDSGVNAKCEVIVTEPVTGIYLNYTEYSMYTGDKFVIIPTISPIDADNKKVTYVSSDPAVAAVDPNGIVTGVKGGSAIIIVTTEERGLVASCKVTVYEFVTSVNIEEDFKYINYGVSRKLNATVKPDTATNKGVVWSTSNKNVITVDAKGKITAVGYGTAEITATAADGSGVWDSITLTVVKPVTSITVAPSSVTLLEGDSTDVNATVTPSDATFSEVDWSSSNEEIATVDHNGTITGVKAGICYVYATSTDGNEIVGRVKVTIKPRIPATGVVINASQVVLLPGNTRELTVRLKPSTSTDGYYWVSTDTSVVKVDSKGVVTAVGQGNAEVYCIADSGVESACEIIVLALNSTEITVEQYDSHILDVFGATEKITWYTSNARVATVNQNGEVIGRSVGSTIITAKVNGKILRCKVNVVKISK
ncbi:MAG: Ig-like domain-containing protein [Lachnospiraceae bacterium]|nr:Ig-like domain-containing protein [Lachnospiraceae bacterium]